MGDQGLRAGWSVLIAVALYQLFSLVLGTIAVVVYPAITKFDFSPKTAIIGELIPLLAMLAAGAFLAMIEHRSILDYHLRDARPALHFFGGAAAGFVALSALVGGLAWGGWLRFGPIGLSGTEILRYAALWGLAFLLVGCVEEGMFRCYLQFTFTRGINFWWALAVVGGLCVYLALMGHGSGAWGVYAVAVLGLLPCLLLQLNKIEGSNFWQAAWVTSTFFGYVHLENSGENWIGIVAAAGIGLVFCVSVRLTGSAWWAIGCHAAWDWAETYFYGTANSGLQSQGHYLTTNPTGAALWSGGADGPEGSLLVLGAIVLLLVGLVLMYGRGKSKWFAVPALEQTAG
jgi:hypothetical protein